VNRAWKRWASSLIVALVLLSSTAMPQPRPNPAPPNPKQFTDQAGNTGVGTKGTDQKDKKDKKDKAVQPAPAVTEAKVKAMIDATQAQHAKDLEPLRQELDSLKRDLTSSKQQLESLKQARPLSEQELDPLRQQVQTNKALGVTALLLGILALIAAFSLFFLQVRSFGHAMVQLRNDVFGQCNDLSKNISELKRKNTDFVPGERFEGLEKLVNRLEERLKALRPVRTFAGGEPPTQSWPPEPDIQQQVSQTSSSFVATAPAKARATTFYADLPDRDGCFKDTGLKDSPDWDTLYKLIPDSNGAYASIEIYSDSQRFEAAMKATQDYLSPVCEYPSNPPTSAKKIRQSKAGRAERDGQVWKVTQKLQIEFV